MKQKKSGPRECIASEIYYFLLNNYLRWFWFCLYLKYTWRNTDLVLNIQSLLKLLSKHLSVIHLHELGLCLPTAWFVLNSPAKKALAFFFFFKLLLLIEVKFLICSVAFSPSCIRPQKTVIGLFLNESPSSIGRLSSVGWTHPGPHWFGFWVLSVLDACLWMCAFQYLCDLCKVLRFRT